MWGRGFIRHARSISAPAEAMGASRGLLLGEEEVFQQQLAQALAASTGALPSHMRLKRRRPVGSRASGGGNEASTTTGAESGNTGGADSNHSSGYHDSKKVHADADAEAAADGMSPASQGALTPLLDGGHGVGIVPLVGEWLHLELNTPESPPAGEGTASCVAPPTAALQAELFFGSIDQRSADAGGSSACACTAVALASWLEQHPSSLPVAHAGMELDDLVRQGCADWRELRAQGDASAAFPDGHFDLDTVLEAPNVRLRAVPGATFVAFVRPPPDLLQAAGPQAAEALEGLLGGAPALSDALAAAQREAKPHAPATAVLSLMDHHCCVRLESSGECVLLDTLGERLYEANDKAFIMRFASSHDLTSFLERCVAAPRLRALAPDDLRTAQRLQCDVSVVRQRR